MYKTVLGIAAASALAAFAASGPANAAEQRQAPGIHQQNVSEEFSSQRRYRRYRVVRPYWPGPRRVYRYGPVPRAYAYPYAYAPYAYAYPYAYP
jgi:hypothetical protein